MTMRTRFFAVAALAISGVGGAASGGVAAHAMTAPPTCIRECSPVIVDTTGPCYGVVVGNNKTLDNFCYLGPPPPN